MEILVQKESGNLSAWTQNNFLNAAFYPANNQPPWPSQPHKATLKFLHQTRGWCKWGHFINPAVYTAATNLLRKNPRHSQQMLKSIVSHARVQSRGGSRFECLQLLELHTLLRLRLCPEAASPLPSSPLRTIMIFRGIIRRVCFELLNNGRLLWPPYLWLLPVSVLLHRGKDF